jgi:hypothetical protein
MHRSGTASKASPRPHGGYKDLFTSNLRSKELQRTVGAGHIAGMMFAPVLPARFLGNPGIALHVSALVWRHRGFDGDDRRALSEREYPYP